MWGMKVLVFRKGEDFFAEFKKFLKSKKIKSGFFYGLGGMTDPILAYYDLKRRKYLEKKFGGDFEVVGMTGNVALLKGEILIHCHLVLGDRKYRSFAGHLVSAKIAGTLEVHLFKFNNKLKRSYDDKTGLKLLRALSKISS